MRRTYGFPNHDPQTGLGLLKLRTAFGGQAQRPSNRLLGTSKNFALNPPCDSRVGGGMGPLHPLVAGWFAGRYGEPTEPQVLGWPLVRAGRDVLISAPTGSGKTLAAFTTALDGLVRRATEGPLPDETLVLYVSPLKALANDVRKNLETPLGELVVLADERGLSLEAIRTATRTGDTTPSERARMLRKPPHILVTTPESLFILLTAERSRALFTHVETVIVDEIHALARDKRGSHLALSLAR